jgi:hypothetical protein
VDALLRAGAIAREFTLPEVETVYAVFLEGGLSAVELRSSSTRNCRTGWRSSIRSAHHRQEPYSAEQAIAGMDTAAVDRALVHPVLWDPDSNELAVEAVHKHPDHFAIMGWFYLDDPNGRDLVAQWKERTGMLGLRFYSNKRHPQSWFTDGTLDWLWPAAERAGVPVALGAALFLPTVGRIAERHPGLKLIVDQMGVLVLAKARRPIPSGQNCWLWPNTRTSRSTRRGRPATPRTNTRSAACTRTCIAVSTPLVPSGCSGAPTSPACLAPGGSA